MVVGRELLTGAVQRLEQRGGLALVDVVAQDQRAQGRERVVCPGAGVGPLVLGDRRSGSAALRVRPRGGQRGEADPLRARRASRVVGVGLEPHEPRAALDLGVGVDQHLRHPPAHRGAQGGLELHALDDGDRVALAHGVTGGDGDGDDHGRRGGAHEPGLAAGDVVHGAVDLDEVVGTLRHRQHAERAPADGQASLEAPGAVHDHVDAGSVALEHDPVVRRLRAGHPQPVGLADDADVDLVPHLVADLGTAALGGEEQAALLAELVGLVGLDRGREQGDVDAARRRVAVGHHRVEPGGVRGAPGDLGPGEQVEQERLVGRAALDDDGGLPDRAGQPGPGLVAGAAPGDHLGDHRVVLRGDDVAGGHAGVDADAGAGGQHEVADRAGRGREAALGVLGGEAGLDGVAGRGGTDGVHVAQHVGERPAHRHVQLELDDVDAGDGLGDRVLHLQARVDLHEREQLVAGVVEELDGAGVDVPRGAGEVGGALAQQPVLLGVQRRGGGLLEDLLVAALDAAVADAERHDAAVAVGDHLHLDVPAAAHGTLEEHRAVAGGALALRRGAGERVVQVLGAGDEADAAPPAARGGLDHQREADLLRGGARGLDVGDRAAAPGRHRHADALGDALRLDLVAEPPHRLGARSDERDAQPLAQRGELGPLGHEAPARPHRVRAAGDERPLELGEVEVGHRAHVVRVVRADEHGLVGLAHRHRVAVDRRVHGDGADRREGALVLGVPLPDGVDQAHRGLATVDDRQALERTRRHAHGRRP